MVHYIDDLNHKIFDKHGIDASTINQKYFNKVIRQSKREGILNGDI